MNGGGGVLLVGAAGGHRVREIYAHGLHANDDFAGLGDWIGYVTHFEDFRTARRG